MRFCKKLLLLFICLFILLSCLISCKSNEGDFDKQDDKKPAAVLYMGDPQSDPETNDYTQWGDLLKSAVQSNENAEVLILGGDIVNDEGDDDEWSAFMSAGAEAFEKLKIRPVTGNHTADATRYIEYFDIPQNGPEGLLGAYYSFDYGEIHFIMLDSMTMGTVDESQISLISDWIKNDLESSDSTWNIAVMHHPMYSLNGSYKDDLRAETMQQNYLPIFEEYDLDFILCGHQHVYSRTYPLISGEIQDGGIVQIMGISGGKHYSIPDNEIIEESVQGQSVYSVISATGSEITIETYNMSGALLDSYSKG